MNKTGRSVLSVLLSLLLIVLPFCGVAAFAEGASAITVIAAGSCGVMDANHEPADNATYTITSDGVMTVRGTGAMADFTSVPNSQPWKAYLDRITTLVIKPGVTLIGGRCFWLFDQITSVSLPGTLREIGQGAFYNCSGVMDLSLPESLQVVGSSAFRECSGLRTVKIPAGVASLGESVFKDCVNLRAAVLPDGLETVPEDLFSGCGNLRTVTVPRSVTAVDKRAFSGCENLSDVYYLGPRDQWDSIQIDGSEVTVGLTTVSGNRALDDVTVHSHYPGGGTSGYTNRNVVSVPTCGATAGYDRVEICAYCCTEIGRTWVQTAPATGCHTPGDPQETVLVPPACAQPGSKRVVVKCIGCDHVFSDTTAAIPPTGDHTPGVWVRVNETAPTCTSEGGRDEELRCANCPYVISRSHVTLPASGHRNSVTVPETAAAAEAHGYTEGVYCADCGTWLSGHAVIHNTLGERTYLDEYTENGEQKVRIVCTVCGESVVYAMEPVSAPGPAFGGPFAKVAGALRSVIDFFLRLLKWFSSFGK